LAVVLLTGVVLMPSDPNKPRLMRGHSSCIANLKQIDGAVQMWALDKQQAATNTYSLSDPTLLAYMKGSMLPECPRGGRYLRGTNVGDPPKCSLWRMGHTL
jgi:hypothetical protein